MTINANEYKIREVPNCAMKYHYIVAREHNDTMYYWGAFNKEEEAKESAHEVHGIVIPLQK